MSKKTTALLIGFGGPTRPEEVRPFLESVLEGIKIPEERFSEVLHHYDAVGGTSFYNSITYKQKEALESWFKEKRLNIEVEVGFRHSTPSFKDAFRSINESGAQRIIGFVLAPFRCYSSFEKYQESVERDRDASGAAKLSLTYTENFYSHPLFIKAQTERVLEVLRYFRKEERKQTFFIFSTHSVPAAISQKDGYDVQFKKTSSLIAEGLALKDNWSVAYQSRSGNPRDAWLEPDVKKAVALLDKEKFRNVVVIPVGFLCDNVEVRYDLDIEVRQTCEERALKYFRAPTVGDHAKFIEMAGKLILEKTGND